MTGYQTYKSSHVLECVLGLLPVIFLGRSLLLASTNSVIFLIWNFAVIQNQSSCRTLFYHKLIHASCISMTVLDIKTKYQINDTAHFLCVIRFGCHLATQFNIESYGENRSLFFIIRKHCQTSKYALHTYLCPHFYSSQNKIRDAKKEQNQYY